MTEYPNVQPPVQQQGDYTLRFTRTAVFEGVPRVFAMVVVTPPIAADPDVVLGMGSSEFEAIADAFARAKHHVKAHGNSGDIGNGNASGR